MIKQSRRQWNPKDIIEKSPEQVLLDFLQGFTAQANPALDIEQVIADSPASHAGLQADDLIVEINGSPTANRKRVLQQLSRIDRDLEFSMTVQRAGQFVELNIAIDR